MNSIPDGKTLTHAHATSFSLAAEYLPESKRVLAYKLYGFCRATDEIIDGNGTRAEKEKQLDAWKNELTRAWESEEVEHSIISDFVHACKTQSISPEWGFRLIEGLKADLTPKQPETFEELYTYCFSAAAIPGILMAHAMDAPLEAMEYAISLGIGMQLTNILRDIREDAEMGRIYLPREEMERFGYTLADLRAHRINPAFVSLMRFFLSRTRAYYSYAEKGISMLPRDVQLGMRLCLVLYREILSEIEAKNYDLFSSRVFVSEKRKNELVEREKTAFLSRIEA